MKASAQHAGFCFVFKKEKGGEGKERRKIKSKYLGKHKNHMENNTENLYHLIVWLYFVQY